MRRIGFGRDGLPAQYGNYLLLNERIIYVHTGRSLGSFSVASHGYEFDFASVYHATDRGFSALSPDTPPQDTNIVVIPETQIALYRGCLTAREYMKQACILAESARY